MIENVSTIGHVAEGRLSVERGDVPTRCAIAAAAVEARAGARRRPRVVLRPGVSAPVATDLERAARAVALVAEAALRLEPSRAEAVPAAPTAPPSAAARSPTRCCPGSRRTAATCRSRRRGSCSPHLGATLGSRATSFVARLPGGVARRLSQQPAHAPVGEHLAAGLAARAVDDPVRLEVDELQRLAAARARLAVVAVDPQQAPVVLQRQHRCPVARRHSRDAPLQHVPDRRREPLAAVRRRAGSRAGTATAARRGGSRPRTRGRCRRSRARRAAACSAGASLGRARRAARRGRTPSSSGSGPRCPGRPRARPRRRRRRACSSASRPRSRSARRRPRAARRAPAPFGRLRRPAAYQPIRPIVIRCTASVEVARVEQQPFAAPPDVREASGRRVASSGGDAGLQHREVRARACARSATAVSGGVDGAHERFQLR